MYTQCATFNLVEFEWDENKERRNLEKHGIDFDQASEIWKGAVLEITRSDRSGEERTVAIGTHEQVCYRGRLHQTWRKNPHYLSTESPPKRKGALSENAWVNRWAGT